MAATAQVLSTGVHGAQERVLTLEDYLELPLDGSAGVEQEVIRGKLVTVARPIAAHQLLSRRLASSRERYLSRRGWDDIQLVVDADLLLDAHNTYVSPDLMVFPPEAVPVLLDIMARQRRIHAFVARPIVVVEILSPDSEERDLVDKLADYRAAGIPHYWVFAPQARKFHELVLDEQTGEYRQRTHTGGRAPGPLRRRPAHADTRPRAAVAGSRRLAGSFTL